jgi:hypothetical protein
VCDRPALPKPKPSAPGRRGCRRPRPEADDIEDPAARDRHDLHRTVAYWRCRPGAFSAMQRWLAFDPASSLVRRDGELVIISNAQAIVGEPPAAAERTARDAYEAELVAAWRGHEPAGFGTTSGARLDSLGNRISPEEREHIEDAVERKATHHASAI